MPAAKRAARSAVHAGVSRFKNGYAFRRLFRLGFRFGGDDLRFRLCFGGLGLRFRYRFFRFRGCFLGGRFDGLRFFNGFGYHFFGVFIMRGIFVENHNWLPSSDTIT